MSLNLPMPHGYSFMIVISEYCTHCQSPAGTQFMTFTHDPEQDGTYKLHCNCGWLRRYNIVNPTPSDDEIRKYWN